jgi:hypothetical protein
LKLHLRMHEFQSTLQNIVIPFWRRSRYTAVAWPAYTENL